MQAEGDKLTFPRDLWVQYGEVDVEESDGAVTVRGRGEDSYVKVLNPFGRLHRLYTFTDGHWVDADTGGEPAPLDEEEVGHLPHAG